jgi:twitching motility protein PilT
VANLIRQGKLDQLETSMQAGGSAGMQTMDSALERLLEAGLIAGKDAYQQANNKSKFQQMKDDE